MVKIPRVDEPTIPTQIANQPNIPMGFGTAPGRELQRMGQTITQVAAKLTAESNKQQEYETQLRQVQLQNKLYTDYTNSTNNYTTEQDPNKWHAGSREKLRSEIDTFINSVPEHMRPRLKVWGETLYGDFDRRYGGFAQGQVRAKFVAGITGAINSEFGKFGGYDPKNGPFDPEKFSGSFGQVQAGVEKIIAAAPGLNEQQKQQLRAAAGQAAAAAIMRAVPPAERLNVIKQYLGKYGMQIGKDGTVSPTPIGQGAAPGSPRGAQEEGLPPGNTPAGTKSGQPQGGVKVPISPDQQTRLQGVRPEIKSGFERLQSEFGAPLKINSGYRSPEQNARVGGARGSHHTHGNALDIDVSGLSIEQRRQVIMAAGRAGFRGFGIGPNIIHVDMGDARSWGYVTNAGGGPVPIWARESIRIAHQGGGKPPAGGTGSGSGSGSGGGQVSIPDGYTFEPSKVSSGASHWRHRNAPYQLAQLASRYGMKPEDLMRRPELIAAYIGIAEGGSGARAKAIAEGVLDRIDIYGGGIKGILKTIAQYDTMTMAQRTRIGRAGEVNSVIASFNTERGKEVLDHLTAVRSGQAGRVVPAGYVGNFSPAAARVQPINPKKWGHVTAPDGRTIYAPTWAFTAIRAGKYKDFNGEILVPQDLSAGAKVKWTSTTGGGGGSGGSFQIGGVTLRPSTVEDHAARVLMKQVPQLLRAHEQGIKKAVDGLYDNAKAGYLIPPQQLEELGRQVESYATPQTKARYLEAMRLATTIDALNKNHPARNKAWLDSLRTQFRSTPPTPEQLKMFKRLEEVVTAQAGKTKTDQLTWANNAGVIKIQPLKLDDEEMLRGRLANVQKAAETYGVSAPGQEPRIHYFTAEERNRLSKTLMTPPTQEGAPPPIVAVTEQLVRAWGASHARRALAELGQSGAGAQALLGGHLVMMGSTPVSRDAGEGLLLRAQKGYKPPFPIKAEDINEAMRNGLGLTFQAMPQTTDALRQLATAAYENRARKLGWTAFDPAKYKEVVLEILGQRTVEGNTYGGIQNQTSGGNGPVLVPPDVMNGVFARRGSAAARWSVGESLMDLVTTKMLTKWAGDVPRDRLGNPISEQRWRSSYLISIGDGRYYVTSKEPSSSYTKGDTPLDHLYTNKFGTPYVFDFANVRETLRARKPDWFIDLPGAGDPYAGYEDSPG